MVAKNVNKHIKTLEEESFVMASPTRDSTTSNLKLSILKRVIAVKLEDAAAKENSLIKKENREKILNIIAEKQDASLKDKTIEELQELIK